MLCSPVDNTNVLLKNYLICLRLLMMFAALIAMKNCLIEIKVVYLLDNGCSLPIAKFSIMCSFSINTSVKM
jgi:hypothetical protein